MRISWTHGLTLVAALQGAILVSTFGIEAASKSGGFLETGDHLDGLVLTNVAGDRLVLPGSEDVLILTYDPDVSVRSSHRGAGRVPSDPAREGSPR